MTETLQQAVDSLRAGGQETAYDSIWAGSEVPVQTATGLEAIMLSNDKLYVVLAVVLIIWIGISVLLLRTDKRIDRLERMVEDRITDEDTL
ncbi:MAG: CcmD family protein [Rhodothermales bacterium]|nr:CcmD family protein [Rhodothermales bacterium]MBO6779624.1 CcmD family protein [Rhodothermales bacterium]